MSAPDKRPLPISPRCLCGEINCNWKTILSDEQNAVWVRAVAKGIRVPREPKTEPLTFCQNCGTTLFTFTVAETQAIAEGVTCGAQ